MAQRVTQRGLLLLATVVLAWGLTWPVNKVILASLTPIWTVAIRSGIGALAGVLGAALMWAGNILHLRGHRWRSTPFDPSSPPSS